MPPYADQYISEKNESVKIKSKLRRMKLSDERFSMNPFGEDERWGPNWEPSPDPSFICFQKKGIQIIFMNDGIQTRNRTQILRE